MIPGRPTPAASVVIVTRDAGRTIRATLASVFAQTVDDFEVIVVDRGSVDDTATQVAAFGDRVRLHHVEGDEAQAWRAGCQIACAPVVMLLAAGDVWMPRKMQRQLEYFRTYPQTGLLAGDALRSSSPHCALRDTADANPVTTVGPAPLAAGQPRTPADRLAISTIAIRRDAVDVETAAQPSDPAVSFDLLCAQLAARVAHGHQDVPVAIERTSEHEPRGAVSLRQPPSLLHDTLYRRTRSAVAGAFHDLDDAIARRTHRPLRILFEAASPMSLAVFGPVYRQLARDPRLQFWFTSCDASWDAATIFASAGITDRVISPGRARYRKFDAYVNTDFWDMTWLPRRTRRVHLFHGVAGKYGLDAPVKIAPVVATFDRLMFPNRDRLNRYAEAGIIDPDSPQAALVGYPKVDCLVDGSLDRQATLERLGLTPSIPTVLYAPTWSPYSSLNTMGHEIVAALGRLGVNVILKLHDRSYDITGRGSGDVDWARRLRRVCDEHGAHLVQDADASPWLHAADLLITDHSSVGFEFMLLDRPIVVIDSPDLITNARINPEKVAQLRQAAFVVRDRDAIASTVRLALDCRAEHHDARQRISSELFYCPGSATTRAVQCMYEMLALPLPESVTATSRSLTALTPLTRIL